MLLPAGPLRFKLVSSRPGYRRKTRRGKQSENDNRGKEIKPEKKWKTEDGHRIQKVFRREYQLLDITHSQIRIGQVEQ